MLDQPDKSVALGDNVHQFLFSPEGLATVLPVANPASDHAQNTLALWHSLSSEFDTEFAVIRGPQRMSMITGRGGYIAEGDRPFNIALLRRSLATASVVSLASEAPAPETRRFHPRQFVLWALAERFSWVETSRTFELSIGTEEFLVTATKSGIGFVAGGKTPADLRQSIDRACEAGAPVDYGFVDLRPDAEDWFPIGSLFQTDDGIPTLAENGWPANLSGMSMPQIAAVISAGQRLHDSGADRLDLFDPQARRCLTLSRSPTGYSVEHTPSN